MLGIGGQELVLIMLMFLLIFGPSKLPQMVRDVGQFIGEARRSVDEFKSELIPGDDEEEDEEEDELPEREL